MLEVVPCSCHKAAPCADATRALLSGKAAMGTSHARCKASGASSSAVPSGVSSLVAAMSGKQDSAGNKPGLQLSAFWLRLGLLLLLLLSLLPALVVRREPPLPSTAIWGDGDDDELSASCSGCTMAKLQDHFKAPSRALRASWGSGRGRLRCTVFTNCYNDATT